MPPVGRLRLAGGAFARAEEIPQPSKVHLPR